jgi:hypothetical protein
MAVQLNQPLSEIPEENAVSPELHAVDHLHRVLPLILLII